MIITIDGPAGTGKSTVAKLVSATLDYMYLDSGALYRTCALWGLRNRVDWNCPDQMVDCSRRIPLRLENSNGLQRVFLADEDVSEIIRSSEVTSLTKYASSNPEVREIVDQIQRHTAQTQSLVTDGRDQGTTVFPHAELKIYLTAEPKTRAARRLKEMTEKGESADFQQVLDAINQRDYEDSHRTVSPMKPADDAVLLATDDLSAEQVSQRIIALANERLNRYRVVFLADLHYKPEYDEYTQNILSQIGPADYVFSAGDLTNFHSQEYISTVVSYIKQYISSNFRSVAGNHDGRNGSQYIFETGLSLNGHAVRVGNCVVLGCDGVVECSKGRTWYTEEDLACYLANADREAEQIIASADQPLYRILLSHSPAMGSAAGLISQPGSDSSDSMGPEYCGSESIRSFMTENPVDYQICGHIHQATGVSLFGRTTVINCGPIRDNRFTDPKKVHIITEPLRQNIWLQMFISKDGTQPPQFQLFCQKTKINLENSQNFCQNSDNQSI